MLNDKNLFIYLAAAGASSLPLPFSRLLSFSVSPIYLRNSLEKNEEEERKKFSWFAYESTHTILCAMSEVMFGSAAYSVEEKKKVALFLVTHRIQPSFFICDNLLLLLFSCVMPTTLVLQKESGLWRRRVRQRSEMIMKHHHESVCMQLQSATNGMMMMVWITKQGKERARWYEWN